jgi:predicted glycogen debranching enzyme
LSPDCLERFTFSYGNGGKWLFHVPTSEGKYYALELVLDLDPGDNHVRLTLFRTSATPDRGGFLEDHRGVTLIIRPDIEDRSFHETVKAFKGPETQWPDAVTPVPGGVFFSLSRGTTLALMVSKGEFIHEPEWHYMIHRAMEAQRGLDADSDLFSPGYFTFALEGGETVCLDAAVIDPEDEPGFRDKNSASPESRSFETGFPLFEAVCRSLDAFIVDRGRDKSVIAGFPWFLDWGRDSLIFCRSLIELGRFAEAKSILRLFGRFENKGTLPNMICGEDARNIETSDAPLWFFACCKDLVEQEKNLDFLNEVLDHRSVKDILLSIAHSLIQGTRTGVKADPETLLLYSPSHFTWMDTNFPAGSPRQGYPVEIQAMWYNALVFLARMDEPRAKEWQKKAEKIQDAVHSLFYIPTAGFFSDCLHSDGPDSGGLGGAKNAHPDDALRPNQLFLVTFDVIRDKTMVQGCVETCLELLVPGAIRSLADRRLETPINIYYNGNLIKDPFSPYSGEYRGDEDTQRKPAYHNGTAWTWPFPVFCEAWAAAFGTRSRSTCLAWLGSVILLMRKGAAGYIPEIIDGDFPHTPRGCDAQAWGSSEFARVMHKLSQ